MDDNNHGTLVAGIIVAKEDNNYGGAGIAPGCRIKVLRCFGANGGGEDDDIARAIVYAADNGIRILNFSFGDIYPSEMMHAAVRYAAAKGVVMVASAGNGTGDNLHYPSSFDEVISVSASALNFDGTSESLWPLSSFGHAVSLCAPGSGIYTTIIRDSNNVADFDVFSGTSTSAPMVTAAVGLLFSQRGPCTPQQIRGILTSSADDIGQTGWDHFTGAGRLNIAKALQTPGASNVQILSPGNDTGSAGDSIYVIGTMLDPQFREAVVEYQAGIAGEDTWIPVRTGISEQILADTLAFWNISALTDGVYTLRLRVDKTNGSTAEDRIRFVIDRTPPVLNVRVATHVWDNAFRRFLIVFRSNDRGLTQLHFRATSSSNWSKIALDRKTRNGHFLLDQALISGNMYEYFLETTNEAGLSGTSPIDTFLYSSYVLNTSGFDTLGYDIPMGYYLAQPVDFDGDGLKEVVMSEYNSRLGFGKLKFYEYNAGEFVVADSVEVKPILIPKGVEDINGDGLMDLLCSVNDSVYVIAPAATGAFPSVTTYTNFGNQLFAARFADIAGNARPGILAKDFVDYKFLPQDG
ncbi:MAG TPA: hypothetical protein ENJ82_16335, partial [Bacteroidetes bacterium]|nr:hypothetical protein [Bacteroidota bacterium]